MTPEQFMAQTYESAIGCWIWTGHRYLGYGRVSNGERVIQAHRWAWEHVAGRTLEKPGFHHRCGVRCCVNPDHLVNVTVREHAQIHAAEMRLAA